MVQCLGDCFWDAWGSRGRGLGLRVVWFGIGNGSCVRKDGVGRATFEFARGTGVEGEGVLLCAGGLCWYRGLVWAGAGVEVVREDAEEGDCSSRW